MEIIAFRRWITPDLGVSVVFLIQAKIHGQISSTSFVQGISAYFFVSSTL